MKLPRLYTVFCLLVLGAFGYGKYQGLDFGNTIPGRSGSSGTSGGGYGGGYHYAGTSGGSHK